MKKTLLAAALIAGYAGAASAQNSVTLYGVIDLGFAYQSIKTANGDTRNQFAMAGGQTAGSRWGLRGVEDLGGGLRANFVYEQGITPNTGRLQGDQAGTSGFGRQSTVGLSSSSWGSVDLGRATTSSTWALSGVDPFGSAYGTAQLNASFGTAFMRFSNMVRYVSPSFSGFSASGSYSFDTGLTNRKNGADFTDGVGTFGTVNKFRALSTGVRYANGPLLLAGSFSAFYAPSAQGKAVKNWNIGGTYDFKVAKIAAAYGQNIDGIANGTAPLGNAAVSGGDTNTQGGVNFVNGGRTQQWMVGLTAPLGQGSAFASFQQKIPGGEFSSRATQSVASVGYTYSLSQRTNVYAYYSYMNNALLTSGVKSQTLGVGVRHFF